MHTHLHCCSASSSSKVKAGAGTAVLHAAPLMDEPVVSTLEVPPVPNPVESDMVSRNCFPDANMSCVENVPLPRSLSKEESGIDTFHGLSNS